MILVTGASGFIGLHLVRSLVASGEEVRALTRSGPAAERVRGVAAGLTSGGNGAGAAIDTVLGDLSDPESLKRAAEGCSAVYHLAGPYRGSATEMHSMHVAGTARMLRALPEGARLVLVSSTSVYGWDGPWPADESTPTHPVSAYGKAKLAAERMVRAWPDGVGVVARPTITYGPGDTQGMLARVATLLAKGMRRLPGTGENRIHLTHVDDVVRGLILLGHQGEGVYVLAGPEAAPTRRLFGLLAEGAGLPAPQFGLPAPLLAAAASAVESAWSLARRSGEAPLSRHAVDVATRDRAYISTRATAELGWEPHVTLDEGIPATGAWLREALDLSAPSRGRKRKEVVRNGDVAQGSTKSRASVAAGNVEDPSLGFDWRGYLDDPDEGLGTVYERFALADVLDEAVARTGAGSVLHAPLFGMMGFPGLDAVFLAQRGIRVGLLDFDEDRLRSVAAQWADFGLAPETHLVDGQDPAGWPHDLPLDYDLVFSFAALWWFDDPWAVLSAQANWARKGVLACVPNRNVFMKLRERLWHQDLFGRLNQDALDRDQLRRAGEELGLRPVSTGLFDIPPFPDTSVPLAKVVRALMGKKQDQTPAGTDAESDEGVWAWSILPYLRGEQPEMADKISRLSSWERFLPAPLAPSLAHHRYTLFVDPAAVPSDEAAATS